MDELYKAALIALRDCMGLKSGETVLVITDEPKRSIGYSLWEAGKELGAESIILEIIPRKSNGEEPPAAVSTMMKEVDVLMCPTSKSLTHTDSRRNATVRGVRIATLPGITEDCMIRCLNADYRRIADMSLKLTEILDKAKVAHVTTPGGTDVTLPLEGMKGFSDTGLFKNKGDWGNLPAGEAYIAPVEGRSNGIIVVDGAMAGLGVLKESYIKMKIVDGFVEDISGGEEAETLKKLIDLHGHPARNVAELGIGTNYRALITGLILEDEKATGTVHIGLGDNKSMGGTVSVPSHLDGILKDPTLEIDGELIMKDGKILV